MSEPAQARLGQLYAGSLNRLHRAAITDRAEVRALLERAWRAGAQLDNGIDRRNYNRTARIDRLEREAVRLRVHNIAGDRGQLFFSFEIDREKFFFVALPINASADFVTVELPEAIYRAERRDLGRATPIDSSSPTAVKLSDDSATYGRARVLDYSYQGLGVLLRGSRPPRGDLDVTFLDGDRAGQRVHGHVRHVAETEMGVGWKRIGMFVSGVPAGPPISIDTRSRIHEPARLERVAENLDVARAVVRRQFNRFSNHHATQIDVVEFRNQRGERISGIVDRCGNPGSPVVVIPPSWGRTKETFLPLARTIVRTFEAAGQSVTVLRFDGTRRRGESYIDSRFSEPGREYLGFKFSQAVADIDASVSYAANVLGAPPGQVVLISFSLASIEGRRAVALNTAGRIGGWVSVVGMVDLQSGLRSVSGGVDYALGLSRGVTFGVHELVGVAADMDLTGRDAMKHRLVYNEDARRDMARIAAPITWIHGRHDAWMSLSKVRELMSAGNTSRRRLLEVPTGHQLRASREALATFRLISEEVSEMALGRRLRGRTPSLSDLDARARAERLRRPRPEVAIRKFWHDYLVGRDDSLGIELMTATQAYRDLIDAQIDMLDLSDGARLLDLGAGAGDLSLRLSERGGPKPRIVVELDLVREALVRSRSRRCRDFPVERIAANLDSRSGAFPIVDSRADAVIAALVVCYLKSPKRFLERAHRSLRPGGRLVVSTLRRDADISKIYTEGLAELPEERVRALFGTAIAERFDDLQRQFLNGASRLLDLEEAGLFHFFDEHEFARLVGQAGFIVEESRRAFGSPPQAIVISAVRR